MRTYVIQYPIAGTWTTEGSRSFGKSGSMSWRTADDGSIHVTFVDAA